MTQTSKGMLWTSALGWSAAQSSSGAVRDTRIQRSEMPVYAIVVNDAVAHASPVLRRMRLDGIDRATVPFEERYVLTWLGSPRSNMSMETVVNVLKVWHATASTKLPLSSSRCCLPVDSVVCEN